MTHNYDLVIELETISDLFSHEGAPFTVKLSETQIEQIEKLLINDTSKEDEDEIIGFTNNQVATINDILFKAFDGKVRVSVLGLFNRGKTFLLNELCGINHDSSFKVHTKGISISVPSSGQIIIIDSAGTNVPLTKTFLDCEQTHFGRFNPTTVDPDTITDSFSKRDEAIKLREIEQGNYHSELTHFSIVRKKNTEVYIQKSLFQLSNVIIIVVNEMTWADQQYISSISANIKKVNSQYGAIKLFVLHNYKNAETMDDFEELRRMYVTDVYFGKLIETSEGATIFNESKNHVQHVFLCKHGSLAGNLINRKSLDFILTNVVSGNFANSIRKNFLQEILQLNEKRISELVRNKGNKIQLCWNVKKKNFTLRAPIEKPDYILPTIEIAPDCTMVLKSSDFLLESDQIIDASSLTIMIDLPGFTESDVGSNHLKIIKDEINYSITITGKRKLSLRKYHPQVENFSSSVQYTDSKFSNVSIERTYGLFFREFLIPKQYDISNFKYNLENGELTLIFLARKASGPIILEI